jgi:cell division protein WhiA
VSFAEVVRHELVERAPGKACCRSAFLSGLIRGAGALQVRGAGEIAVVAEIASPAAARMAFQLLRERGADCDIVTYRERRFDRRNLVQLRIHGDRSLQLLHEIGLLTSALVPTQDIPQRVLSRACCRGAYLRGAFVAAGSVSAPGRPAHLEIRVPDIEHAAALCEIAAREGLELRAVPRRGHAIAYAKRRETVHDLLVSMGVQDAVLSFDEAEVVSRTLERANRLTNCDRANLERASAAAHRQREAIAELDLTQLSAALRQVAELRLRYPSASLSELAERARPPLTKSTVARRMRALLALQAGLGG